MSLPACSSVSEGVLILAGATASGKTDIALDLATTYDAEIVGADSRQIYREMPIGTAAPTIEQMARVPHHLVAFLDPAQRYSAARYASDAIAAIRDIVKRGKRAIVAGPGKGGVSVWRGGWAEFANAALVAGWGGFDADEASAALAGASGARLGKGGAFAWRE